jgi:hypothetical protein
LEGKVMVGLLLRSALVALAICISSAASLGREILIEVPDFSQSRVFSGGSLDKIRADYGIDELEVFGLSGSGIGVAVIDTGVDYGHEFLKNRVLKGACYNTVRPQGFRSTCHLRRDRDESPGAGRPCGNGALCMHGTHVAGVAAGFNTAWSTGEPRKGVAPKAFVVPINVFSYNDATKKLHFSDEDLALALDYVIRLRTSGLNIRVVNMSLDTGSEAYLKNCTPKSGVDLSSRIQRLRALGVISVAASGNSGFRNRMMALPACLAQVVEVGNVGSKEMLHGTSNLAALNFPGVMISSAIPGNRYAPLTGTSMAAPILSGAYALAMQAQALGKAMVGNMDYGASIWALHANHPAGCDVYSGQCLYAGISPHLATAVLRSYIDKSRMSYFYPNRRNARSRLCHQYGTNYHHLECSDLWILEALSTPPRLSSSSLTSDVSLRFGGASGGSAFLTFRFIGQKSGAYPGAMTLLAKFVNLSNPKQAPVVIQTGVAVRRP